ncbi:MAG: cyclic nucleotide-binding domain-containing protein [Planctomycetes bacterium]|nr:cyclic nucleotide-binding domain-containing protein [Planctomycetota bacterium]
MTGKLLTRYPLIRLLSAQQLDEWLAAGQEVDYDSGVTLFQENTPGAWVYLVETGRVRILRQIDQREITLGLLQPGDMFGEYALLPPGRNTATCRTALPSQLLRLPLGSLRTVLQSQKSVWKNLKNWLRLHTLLHFCRQRAFLGFISAESGLRLLDRLQPTIFPAGQTIQANGLAEDYWYLIEQGTVRLHVGDAPVAAEELGPGEAFGERGLVGSGIVSTAVALTDVRCQVLTRHDIDPTVPVRTLFGQSYEPRHQTRPEAHVWVPQLEETDCGLASLAMVGLRLGVQISVEQLRQKITPDPQGLSLQQLGSLATAIGLSWRAVRVSAARLGQVTFPAIAHLNGGHYVVLHELSEAGIVIGDPASGVVTWKVELFAQCYTGSLVLFDRPEK